MWVTSVVYQHGLRGLWYTFFSAWCAISAFVNARIFRRSLAYSQAERRIIMVEMIAFESSARPESLFWGVAVPALIFAISFALIYALYRKFSHK
jgi:hypothetical protein